MNFLKKIRFIYLIYFTLSLLACSTFADDGFVIKHITVEGLQRIPLQTVMDYIPVHIGQSLTQNDTGSIIRKLYQTGFFSDVTLSRKGDTLIIDIVERPTIGLIKLSGNKQIKKTDLMNALKQNGIIEGNSYDPALLDAIRQSLIEEYHKSSHYDATVDIKIIPQSRNRVELDILIGEGKVFKVQKITLSGNTKFSSQTLLNQLDMNKKPWWAFLSTRDEYSEIKLQEDIKKLENFYTDRGYLHFKVDSQTIIMRKENKKPIVTIALHLNEGPLYRISGYRLLGSSTVDGLLVSRMIHFKPGEVFSRQKIMSTTDKIGRFYADQGYAMAQINTEPAIDEIKHQIFLTFNIVTGQRIYVRKINYEGNTKTADVVLRRETRQMEGSVYSISQQDESKRRLNNLGYLENIESNYEPVAGKPNQVDLKYKVKEASSLTASAQVGYSDAYGIVYGANVIQKNFKGSGKTVGVGFNNSSYIKNYSFNYFNPYYTNSMSRGFTLYFQKMTPDDSDVAAYTLDTYGGTLNYRMPLSEYDYLSFGYGYEYLHVKSSDNSNEINDFITADGDHFNNTKINVGWTHNNYDRIVLPTKGINEWLGIDVGLPILPDSLKYYRFSYNMDYYQPLGKDFIALITADLGYGNSYGGMDYPFFKNFYAGGMGTVRGYSSNTLGPRDSANNALGGNVLLSGGVNLILPNHYVMEGKLRPYLFLDAGNVFENSVDFNDLRYSVGFGIDCLLPIGLLKISFGHVLNPSTIDDLQFINFSVGTNF